MVGNRRRTVMVRYNLGLAFGTLDGPAVLDDVKEDS